MMPPRSPIFDEDNILQVQGHIPIQVDNSQDLLKKAILHRVEREREGESGKEEREREKEGGKN